MASHNGDLEVRWLVHSPFGPVVVRVQTRQAMYLATLVAPPPELHTVGHVTAATADEALRQIIEAVGGGTVIALPPRERLT